MYLDIISLKKYFRNIFIYALFLIGATDLYARIFSILKLFFMYTLSFKCKTHCCIFNNYSNVFRVPFLISLNNPIIYKSAFKVKSENVDIQVLIKGIKGTRTFVIYTQQLKAKRAVIKIDVQGHSMFESELLSKPDFGTLHIHTDKNIYSAGEIGGLRSHFVSFFKSILYTVYDYCKCMRWHY
uniref:Methyltransf_21 domain-containing protein n=1 Tax=Heterorhabditis bacteriophora TaxID=37862 RepID=A0A1I7WNX0_HETBA